EPTTITVAAEPRTITEFITVTPSSSSAPPSTASRSPPAVGIIPAKAVWIAPGNMSDLSSFRVAKYAGGKQIMKVVTGIPAKATADPSLPQWDNASSALQLLFPENSIDPANEPQGGADFYATPIDISEARNVTLRYSVFFPADFDWVLAGKLPGLYGGHTGCSGGNAALDCFSTRLMWRQNGAGELYLYAPKDKQTKDLCDDPQSVCDAAYGLSVGRGSFSWTAGSWTTVEQTVYLNTPGSQDGGFALDVNGVRVLDRKDVFYR
ncbi:polysaccharide lyase family 14 protein, partial [Hebeloma cylindrosporum]